VQQRTFDEVLGALLSLKVVVFSDGDYNVFLFKKPRTYPLRKLSPVSVRTQRTLLRVFNLTEAEYEAAIAANAAAPAPPRGTRPIIP
jgi:hypothetical protein